MDKIMERVTKLENDVNNLFIRLAVVESDIKNVYKKLDRIDAHVTWLLYIVIGAIIAAILNNVIVQ